jgi:hypothetical protein
MHDHLILIHPFSCGVFEHAIVVKNVNNTVTVNHIHYLVTPKTAVPMAAECPSGIRGKTALLHRLSL